MSTEEREPISVSSRAQLDKILLEAGDKLTVSPSQFILSHAIIYPIDPGRLSISMPNGSYPFL